MYCPFEQAFFPDTQEEYWKIYYHVKALIILNFILANGQIPLRKMYYHVNAWNRAHYLLPQLFGSLIHIRIGSQLSGPMPSHLGRSKE